MALWSENQATVPSSESDKDSKWCNTSKNLHNQWQNPTAFLRTYWVNIEILSDSKHLRPIALDRFPLKFCAKRSDFKKRTQYTIVVQTVCVSTERWFVIKAGFSTLVPIIPINRGKRSSRPEKCWYNDFSCKNVTSMQKWFHFNFGRYCFVKLSEPLKKTSC